MHITGETIGRTGMASPVSDARRSGGRQATADRYLGHGRHRALRHAGAHQGGQPWTSTVGLGRQEKSCQRLSTRPIQSQLTALGSERAPAGERTPRTRRTHGCRPWHAYILIEVIHDWPDAESAAILTVIRQAASPGARVLSIENVLGDVESDPRGHILDVILLAVTCGRERTGNQLRVLVGSAGFADGKVINTGDPMRIVEAVAA